MKNIVNVVKSLPKLLALKPATNIQITDAEIQLRLGFSDEYKEYLLNFGAIMAEGIELTGIAKSEHRNVVAQTKKEWSLNPKVLHNMYVIENTCIDGIIIWQDQNGTIYQTSPNSEPKKIADSLCAYLTSRANNIAI